MGEGLREFKKATKEEDAPAEKTPVVVAKDEEKQFRNGCGHKDHSLLVLEAIVSLSLIILMVTQTSKNEGFGTIGVQTPTNFKGKPGFEERLQQYTRNLAITWFVLGSRRGRRRSCAPCVTVICRK